MSLPSIKEPRLALAPLASHSRSDAQPRASDTKNSHHRQTLPPVSSLQPLPLQVHYESEPETGTGLRAEKRKKKRVTRPAITRVPRPKFKAIDWKWKVPSGPSKSQAHSSNEPQEELNNHVLVGDVGFSYHHAKHKAATPPRSRAYGGVDKVLTASVDRIEWVANFSKKQQREKDGYTSLALQIEMKVREIMDTFTFLKSPHTVRTTALCELLDELCVCLPSLQSPLQSIAHELYRSIFVDYDANLHTPDCHKFDGDTWFSSYLDVLKENDELNSLVAGLKRRISDMEEQRMAEKRAHQELMAQKNLQILQFSLQKLRFVRQRDAFHSWRRRVLWLKKARVVTRNVLSMWSAKMLRGCWLKWRLHCKEDQRDQLVNELQTTREQVRSQNLHTERLEAMLATSEADKRLAQLEASELRNALAKQLKDSAVSLDAMQQSEQLAQLHVRYGHLCRVLGSLGGSVCRIIQTQIRTLMTQCRDVTKLLHAGEGIDVLTSLSSEESLLRWVNHQTQAALPSHSSVSNFSDDFKDCSVLYAAIEASVPSAQRNAFPVLTIESERERVLLLKRMYACVNAGLAAMIDPNLVLAGDEGANQSLMAMTAVVSPAIPFADEAVDFLKKKCTAFQQTMKTLECSHNEDLEVSLLDERKATDSVTAAAHLLDKFSEFSETCLSSELVFRELQRCWIDVARNRMGPSTGDSHGNTVALDSKRLHDIFSAEKFPEVEFGRCQEVVTAHAGVLEQAYRYYTRCTGEKASLGLSPLQYMCFARDCGFPGKKRFTAVAVEQIIAKVLQGDKPNPKLTFLSLPMFLESLVRVAAAKMTSSSTSGISSKLSLLLASHVLPFALLADGKEVKRLLANDRVQATFQKHQTIFFKLFTYYDREGGVTLQKFESFVQDVGMETQIPPATVRALFGNIQSVDTADEVPSLPAPSLGEGVVEDVSGDDEEEGDGYEEEDEVGSPQHAAHSHTEAILQPAEFQQGVFVVACYHDPNVFTPAHIKLHSFLDGPVEALLKRKGIRIRKESALTLEAQKSPAPK